MNAPASSEGDPTPNLGGALGGALIPALGWSSEIAVRFGHTVGVVQTLVAALGSTALTLGSVAVVAQRGRMVSGSREAMLVGTLVASGPIALLGAMIGDKTHHRALGGVTFACAAAAIVGFGFLVARRALIASRGSSPIGRAVGLVLTILVVSSLGVAILPLVREFHAPGSGSGRFLAEDLAVGAALAALVVARRNWAPRARTGRAAGLGWALAVAAGWAVLVANMPLRAMLASHAPVALGPLGLGLGIAAADAPPGIPSRVDVSLH